MRRLQQIGEGEIWLYSLRAQVVELGARRWFWFGLSRCDSMAEGRERLRFGQDVDHIVIMELSQQRYRQCERNLCTVLV